MRVAPVVVVLVRDADGFGAAISDALCPNPDYNLTRSESSPFEISLEKYGIKDRKASGDLIQFLDPDGSPQVSILLLQNYEPPIAACAINELLLSVSFENSSTRTIVLPIVMKALKFDGGTKNRPSLNQEVMLYGAELAGRTKFTEAIIGGAVTLHPSLRVHNEPLSCLLQMVHVLNIPTAVLVASGSQLQSKRSIDINIEALIAVGQHLAGHLGLHFAKEEVILKHIEKPIGLAEPWRELYG